MNIDELIKDTIIKLERDLQPIAKSLRQLNQTDFTYLNLDKLNFNHLALPTVDLKLN